MNADTVVVLLKLDAKKKKKKKPCLRDKMSLSKLGKRGNWQHVIGPCVGSLAGYGFRVQNLSHALLFQMDA